MSSHTPPRRIRLGILTPSSNTALEPLTHALLQTINSTHPSLHITVHFSRFPVTTISLTPDGLAQFDPVPILAAASLLADAHVHIIGWSGTSSGWLGFDADVQLCAAIEAEFGVKATTSVLALNKALELWGVKKLGLVTPYSDDVQAAIVQNYERLGVQMVERHLRVSNNWSFGEIKEEVLDGMVKEVTGEKVDAVTTFCTNLVAAQRVGFWEEEYGVPVFDTVTTVVWDMLRECAVDVTGLEGWGMIFKK